MIPNPDKRDKSLKSIFCQKNAENTFKGLKKNLYDKCRACALRRAQAHYATHPPMDCIHI